MTFVPHTGHFPCAALRPFLSVTSSPSNSRFSRHFTQYASYVAMSPPPLDVRDGGDQVALVVPDGQHEEHERVRVVAVEVLGAVLVEDGRRERTEPLAVLHLRVHDVLHLGLARVREDGARPQRARSDLGL